MLKESESEWFYLKSMLAANRILAGHGCAQTCRYTGGHNWQ